MNKSFRVLVASLLVAISFGLVGCQTTPPPAEEPQDVLQDGLSKLMEVSSNSYTFSVKGDLKGPAGEEPEKVVFNFNASGSVDTKDSKDPKFNLSIKGDAMMDNDGGDLEAAFRMNKDAIYLSLIALDGKGEITIPDEIKSELVGKWWTMPIPPGALEELASTVPSSDVDNMTPEQKKIKELFETTKFFKDVEYKGSENVGGEPSHRYSAKLDKDAMVGFIVKIAEMQGSAIGQAEITEIKMAMGMFDFAGDLYVGQKSGVLNKVNGVFTLNATSDASTPSGTITIQATASDFNKPVTVQVPANALPIPMDMLGALPI